MKRADESTVEVEGWFTVPRAAALLGVTVPRIFDQIRDGKLQVRFEPGEPGKNDRPLVTSPELKQRCNGLSETRELRESREPVAAGATAVAPQSAAATATAATAATAAATSALLEETRRATARLENDLRDARTTLDEADRKLDASLKAIYERDVQIARLEAELGAREKLREDGETFIRHLESRLDKTEERSEEKEKEIRRLAVGLGEARGEIRLLKPPAPELPAAWKRHLARAFLLLGAIAAAGGFGWMTFALATKSLPREAAGAAAAGVLAAFVAGLVLDRLRRSK